MTDERRFYEAPAADGARRSAPAALRNREPIAEVLADWLPASGLVLEIASGTRRACAPFRRALSRRSTGSRAMSHPDALASIAAWRAAAGLPNVRAPITIDAPRPTGRSASADAMLSINMVHISPWASALGLIAGAARVLPARRSADPLRAVAQGRHRDRAEQSGVRRRP